jgi:hypothetical protein
MHHDEDQRQNGPGRGWVWPGNAMSCSQNMGWTWQWLRRLCLSNRMAPGSDVTSYSNENPSITPFFRLRNSSNTPSILKGYHNSVLLPFWEEVTLSVLQILDWEMHGRTGTIQGKFTICTTYQPVKSEPGVKFSAQGLRHNSQGSHEKARSWRCLLRLRAVTFRRRGTRSKGK